MSARSENRSRVQFTVIAALINVDISGATDMQFCGTTHTRFYRVRRQKVSGEIISCSFSNRQNFVVNFYRLQMCS